MDDEFISFSTQKITLNASYSQVIMSVMFILLINSIQHLKVLRFRSKFNVHEPDLQLSVENGNAQKQNCIQRGQLNTLESMNSTILIGMLNGVLLPKWASVQLCIQGVGIYQYAEGYANGVDKRVIGAVISFQFGQIPLVLMILQNAGIIMKYWY